MKQFIIHGTVASKKNSKEITIRYVKNPKTGRTSPKPFVRSSDRYMQWHDSAITELMYQKQGFFIERGKIILKFYFGDRIRRDADNGVSSVFDTLTDAGIIPDDNWNVLFKHMVECDYDKSNPRVEVYIYSPDEKVVVEF
ncbi:MAG: RusA family crossover junction endodeoxyribonuclease [Bacilli bacterium]|nr:RusA family crossover junction endodeoxyribonuclease [Bacilli bacterium]